VADRPSARRDRHAALAVAFVLACGLTGPANADIRINGDPRTLQLRASGDSLAEVLARFDTLFAIKCRSAVPLNTEINGSYSGSLSQVMARLLDGYNYVIKNDHEQIEIIVLGRAGEAAVVPKTFMATPVAAAKSPASRWR